MTKRKTYPAPADRLLSRAWAIEYIGCFVSDFDKYISKHIPTVRLDGKTFYRQRDLDNWEIAINRKVIESAGLEI